MQPDIFVAVPRVYEKIRQQVILKTTGFPQDAIYRWALSVGRAHRAEILAGVQPTSTLLEDRESSGLFQGARRHGRQGGGIHFRRRAARPGIGGVVCRYRHSAFTKATD